MTSEDDTRRLARLKRRPTLAGKDDDYLLLCIEDAGDFFREYTHLSADPGEEVDNIVCDLALFAINQEGVENVQSASEGEVSRSYYEGIPPMLVHRMNGYRRIVGLM